MRTLNVLSKLATAMVLFCVALAASALTPTNDALRAELEKMKQTDQQYRRELVESTTQFGSKSDEVKALWAMQAPLDQANIKRLLEIVESRGWPLKSEVGDEASHAAFLVLQHADIDTQRKLLPIVRQAAVNKEFRLRDLAMLEDRILVRDGKPQIYGTQSYFDPQTNKPIRHTIADEDNVNKRRDEVGLAPLNGYAKKTHE